MACRSAVVMLSSRRGVDKWCVATTSRGLLPMRWLFCGLFAASVTMLGLSPALAVSCGPGTLASVQIDLTGIAGTSCGVFGNGNPTLAVLPGPDPLESLGFTKLDSTKAGDNGPVPL